MAGPHPRSPRGRVLTVGVPGQVRDLLPRCTFPPPGHPVTLAVSGGADSLTLLVLAVATGLAPTATAVHVDHGLRPGSAAEASVVAAAAERFGLAFRSQSCVVADGPNLEARARAARYSVLPADVLTGHTADDRAETILLNLLWGAGLDGLSAMRPSQRRPLLGLRRAETESVCRLVGIEPVHDPSNADARFRRNRIRHELLPLLADVAGRDPVPVLCRQADLLADDADLLDNLAAGIDPTDAKTLAAAPLPLARRVVRTWLRASSPNGQPPSAAEVERVLAVAREASVATEVDGGRRVTRTAGRLRIEPPLGLPDRHTWQDAEDG